MSDPEALLAQEARSMGSRCVLTGHAALDVGPHRVDFLTYSVPPRDKSDWPYVQHRWAVVVDGRTSSSGIAGSERA